MSDTHKSLKSKGSVWTKVFRAIVAKIEADPDVKRVVGADNIRSWRGVPADKSPLEPSQGRPVVRLTPRPGNLDWHSPESQIGRLYVDAEIAVQTLCIDDVIDLWDMMLTPIRACQFEFNRALIAAGAEDGEIVFGDPAVVPNPEGSPEGFFVGKSSFYLAVIRPLFPL